MMENTEIIPESYTNYPANTTNHQFNCPLLQMTHF